jgi:putative Mg2+ transporter-C (MgtC) family protein
VAFEFSPLVGIAAAAVLGGAIGIQRQAAAKPAGLRTHLLVATAAAAFTAMGAHLHDTRIPSYIVVGIGFLGSGAIVRHGTTPHGLTTAASIWMAAAVGLALGYSNSFGLYVGLLATALTLIALSLSDTQMMMLCRIPRRATIRITSVSPQISTSEITNVFTTAGLPYESSDLLAVSSEGASQVLEMTYVVELRRGRELNALVRELGALSGVRKVEANEPFFGA